MNYAHAWTYSTSSATVKLSLLAFYWRVFPTTFIRRSCIILGTFCTSFLIAMLVINALLCRPIKLWWEGVGPGTCLSGFDYVLSMSIINFVVDLCTLVLPIREVWRLQASRRRKFALCGVFLVGSM